MHKYRLIYLPFRGRGEVTRILFAIGGIPYEDVRVERSEWPALKPTSPFGGLPILEIDDKVLCQSHTIEKYLAKPLGLVGDSEWNETRIEMIVACLEDFRAAALIIFKENDPQRKEEKRARYQSEQLPFYLEKINALLPEGDDFFVGNKMSWADIAFMVYKDVPREFAGVPVNYSEQLRLKALTDRVEAHPKIAEWIAKRPQSDK